MGDKNMKLKLVLMTSFCFLIASCGGGSGGGGDVYDEYHDLVCKAANVDGSMSMSEVMKFNQEVAEFADKKASQMTDPKKVVDALDISRC